MVPVIGAVAGFYPAQTCQCRPIHMTLGFRMARHHIRIRVRAQCLNRNAGFLRYRLCPGPKLFRRARVFGRIDRRGRNPIRWGNVRRNRLPHRRTISMDVGYQPTNSDDDQRQNRDNGNEGTCRFHNPEHRLRLGEITALRRRTGVLVRSRSRPGLIGSRLLTSFPFLPQPILLIQAN